jgi:hypothetical protein
MTTRNLTVSLDKDTIRKAKVIAAQHGMSVSRLVAEVIEQLTGEEEGYRIAMREAVATLEQGFDLGGTIRPSRDELHDRAALR